MIEIKKSSAPPDLVKLQQDAVAQGLTANQAYDTLRNPLKGGIIELLLKEQGHICAYCMRRIPDERKGLPHVKIEHWNARNGEHGETCGSYGALDYGNFLAVCSGNQNGCSKGKEEKLTCDASRGNKKLIVNPLNPETLSTIYYTEDGMIAASDSDINKDLTITLNLNCMRDSVQLPKERKRALDEIQAVILSEVEAGNSLLESCTHLYRELLKIEDKKPAYIGISLWWLKDCIDRLTINT
ncbi:hypothetical protein [Ruminococcus callidus]|uniref:hypothetical protein n=1 Tax=Ruminococcus callidus TaxID=40519 RepID=UPI003521B7DC